MTAMPDALIPAPYPGEAYLDLPARLRAVAAADPGAIVLVDGDTLIGAGEVSRTMDRVAAALAEDGVGPGDVVASLAGVSAAHLLLYLGTLAAGACMAPLPVSAHPDALARMIANCRPTQIYGDGAIAWAGAADLDALMVRAETCAPAPPRAVPAEALFDIIYSSGTTGQPKGIEHDCRFRDRQMQRFLRFGLGPGSVTLISTPIYSNTTLATLLPALGGGSRVVLMRKFDEVGYLELAERHGATHSILVPVQIKRLIEHPEFDRFDLSAFQAKLSTSAPLPAPLVREVLARWPGKMINIYGMTEGGVSAVLDCGAHPDKLHTVGRAPENAEIRILGEDGRTLPVGEVGEIVGRSPTIMRGYRDAPEATAAATWTSPEGHVFIRTGDMGRLDADGFLTLMDRKKDMIVSGGFNIFASDLEAVLADHPDIREAAVIGVPSARWGETPVACVVLWPGRTVDARTLRDWANDHLGRTQRLTDLEIVPDLPRSAIGKVLKRQLQEDWQAKRPVPQA
jgi:long-chain acyl-CoA synthetase